MVIAQDLHDARRQSGDELPLAAVRADRGLAHFEQASRSLVAPARTGRKTKSS